METVKIMVVEDESIVAKDIQNRLKKFGYLVPAIASSGEEAIDKAGEINLDLVLMDIRLKGAMDGIEAAQQIYKRFQLPVIYLTAYADEDTLNRAKDTQPFGYILKPFKERELSTTIEITLARHRLERQLKEREQWLATVLRSIADAVITTDLGDRISFMNPAAEMLTGWPLASAAGQSISELLPVDSRAIAALLATPTEGLSMSIASPATEAVLQTRQGEEVPIEFSVTPLDDPQGDRLGMVIVFRNITERLQAQEAVQKQIEQARLLAELKKLNQLKDDFLSTVSHELRTPMSNMKMALQMLTVATNAERQQRYLEILKAECAREIELINDLLDLQRLEAASYPSFLAEAIQLQHWLPMFLDAFRSRMQERQQILQLEVSPDLPALITDRGSLERILAELLNNACKYTAAGGEIVLRAYQVDADPGVPSFTVLIVQNQADISANELPRIFDKFYRVPHADPWKQGGTGLGLALVQKLVDQLQGSIQAESSQGWTTFTVQLPMLGKGANVASN